MLILWHFSFWTFWTNFEEKQVFPKSGAELNYSYHSRESVEWLALCPKLIEINYFVHSPHS